MSSENMKRKKILLSHTKTLLFAVRESILQTSQVSPLIASHPEEIMSLIRFWEPDLLIIDGDDIVSTAQAIKESKEFRDIPMIAVVHQNRNRLRDRVLATGCDDWIPTPIEEIPLLNKIQDLIGIRFRKLPRYSHNAPALVSFRGKNFPSCSIDINHRMIFLESSEGLAPATGRNVKLRFQLTKEEPITCWGRVVRLMARKSKEDNQEKIGMLIRFLDLPPSAAKRIDYLALQQSAFLEQDYLESKTRSFDWHNLDFYKNLAKEVLKEGKTVPKEQTTLPFPIIETYLKSLSNTEKSAFEGDSENALSKSIAARLKLMDDLAKFRHGASSLHIKDTLDITQNVEEEVQKYFHKVLGDGQGEDILRWARIKYELVRSRVELEALKQGKSVFYQAFEIAKEKTLGPFIDWKYILVSLLLIISLVTNARFIYQRSQIPPERSRTYPINNIKSGSENLIAGEVVYREDNPWLIFHGNLSETWPKMTLEKKKTFCENLGKELQKKGIHQVFLFDPNGKLRAGVINGQVSLF